AVGCRATAHRADRGTDPTAVRGRGGVGPAPRGGGAPGGRPGRARAARGAPTGAGRARGGRRMRGGGGPRTRVRFERRRGAMAVLRARARVSATVVPIRRPIFVLGCPRSGTTVLFAMLRRHPDLAGSDAEGHVLWDAYQHPARRGWDSDRST